MRSEFWARTRLVPVLFGLLLALGLHGFASAQAPDPTGAELAQLTEEVRQAARDGAVANATTTARFQRRRAIMQALLQRDPDVALLHVVEPELRQKLPAALQALVEERTYRVGQISIVHSDPVPGSGTKGEYVLYLHEGTKSTELRIARTVTGLEPGSKVLIAGTGFPTDPTVATDDVVVLGNPAWNAVVPTGVQRTAVILSGASGTPGHPFANTTNTASIVFSRSSPVSMYSHILESSYGQSQIAGVNGAEGTSADVFGPYVIAGACDFNQIVKNSVLAASASADFNLVSRVIVLYDYPAGCGGWAGKGSVGVTSPTNTDGADQYFSASVNIAKYSGSTGLNAKASNVPLHEFGHNLGLWHSWTVECGLVAVDGTCTEKEYGDPASIMGNSEDGHYNGFEKEQLGWLDQGKLQTVSTSGTYSLSPLETSTGVKVLKVPRARDANGNPTSYYYVEYRVPTTNWRSYVGSWTRYNQGVLLHVTAPQSGSSAQHSQLVDTQPKSLTGDDPFSSTQDFNDAPLNAGETYADTKNSVTVQVTSADANGAQVVVNVDPPTVSAPTTASPGSTVRVTWSGIHGAKPGNWLGLYAKTAADTARGTSWKYVGCSQTIPAGALAVPSGFCDFTAPTINGTYEFRLFSEAYTQIATSNDVELTGGVVPTSTPTRTVTRTPTQTRTPTATRTPTSTRTATGTRTATATRTITRTPTVTTTRTETPTRTPTRTTGPTQTRTPTSTRTASVAPTQSPTRTVTMTRTPSVTRTTTSTATATITRTPVPPGPPTLEYETHNTIDRFYTVTWTNIPSPASGDWIAMYEAGASDRNVRGWKYLNCTQFFAFPPVPSGSCLFELPREGGTFEFRLFSDNSYTLISQSAPVTIAPAAPIRPARVTWETRALSAELAPGESTSLTARFTVSQPVESARFRTNTRGEVALDLSSLPKELVPGTPYELRLTARMPVGPAGRLPRTTTLQLVRADNRAIEEALRVTLRPRTAGP